MGIEPTGAAEGTSHWKQYVIELWDADGNTLTILERRVPWFTPLTGPEPAPQFESDPPFHPYMLDLSEDEGGRIWVLVRVPDANWRSGIRRGDTPDGPGGLIMVDPDKVYGTIIEVINPTDGIVLASQRLDNNLHGFSDNTHVHGYRENAQGVPTIGVLRMDLDCS